MTGIIQILDRFRAANRSPMGGGLALELDPTVQLRDVIATVEELEAKQPADARPSRSILHEAQAALQAAAGRVDLLTARQIRALCWDADCAMQPEFIEGIGRLPDLATNRRWIEGLVDSYVTRWRSMPRPEAYEAALRRVVGGFAGRSERLALYRPVVDRLFSGSAPQWLADVIVSERRPLAQTLREWRIDQSTGLGEATANAAVAEWTRRFNEKKRNVVGTAAYGWFRQLTQELLASDLVGPEVMAKAISALVLWDQAERDTKIHADLRAFLIADPRFGDPRIPNRKTIWDLCHPDVRQRAVGWLAKDDLLFFFKFVIRDDPHGRRDFWLRYISTAADAYVALSDEDDSRLRARVRDRPLYGRVLAGQGTSAFLMRFKGAPRDLLCIEFSKTGNALHVHDADRFIERYQTIRRPEFTLSTELKNHTTRIERFSHAGSWAWGVQSFLSRHGVRPA